MTAPAVVRLNPRRRASARRATVALGVMAALAGLWLALASRIHVNASWSDGAWGYLLLPLVSAPAIGDQVLFEPPEALGSPVPWLKTVRGLPGAAIAVDADRTVRLDGVPIGRAKARALDGRALVPVTTGVVPAGHYFLHADHPDSHDSRYAEIGPVPVERILGRAIALPDLPWIGLQGPLTGPQDVRTDGGKALR